MAFVERVSEYISAGYQSLLVSTSELGRCEQELRELCNNDQPDGVQAILVWDCVSGLTCVEVCQSTEHTPRGVQELLHHNFCKPRAANVPTLPGQPRLPEPLVDPADMLRYLESEQFPIERCVIIMRNLNLFMARDPSVIQLWLNLFHKNRFNYVAHDEKGSQTGTICRMPILMGTAVELGPIIKPTVTNVEFELPSLDDLKQLFDMIQQATDASRAAVGKPIHEISAEEKNRLCHGLLGLSMTEATHTLSLCGVRCGSLGDPLAMTVIETEKAVVLKRNAALTYYSRDQIAGETEVGGFGVFKQWLAQRQLCYTIKAEELKLDRPRGVVLLGIPGTGKSLTAKTAARILGLPLVMLNMGGLLGSLLGESEARTDDTLRTVDALQGCVLLIDEADKGLQGSSGAVTDSGVMQRVFGKLLTWLAEKKSNTFVIMTMNTMKHIPAELFRRGRFDDVFYVTLPDEEERQEILSIHLRQRGVDPTVVLSNKSDWTKLIKATTDFVGAELEEVVKEARLAAFVRDESGQPSLDDLLTAAKTIVPTVRLDPDTAASITAFCKDRARPVHVPLPPATTGKRSAGPRVSAGSAENN